LVAVLLFFVFWSLYCCSLSFGRCIVVLCLLVAVLLFFVFRSLYYCSLSFQTLISIGPFTRSKFAIKNNCNNSCFAWFFYLFLKVVGFFCYV
jgi:hypothetical protein